MNTGVPTPRRVAGAREEHAAQIEPAKDWAFFLDVDGTLVEIAEAPAAVEIQPRLVPTLARLRDAAGEAVALVSGRSIADLDRLLEPLRLPAAGLHGLERRDAQGRTWRQDSSVAALADARQTLGAFVRNHPGVLMEDKGLTLALHYRQAAESADAARQVMQQALADLGDRFRLQAGKMVLELRPFGPHKGTVIATFMAEAPFAGRRAVFIGDDVTDEDGFMAVNRIGGVSIRVGGSGATSAAWRIDTVDDLLSWLDSAARGMAERSNTAT